MITSPHKMIMSVTKNPTSHCLHLLYCAVGTVCKPNYTTKGCTPSPTPGLLQHQPRCVVDMLYMVCIPLRGSTAWPLLQRDSLLLCCCGSAHSLQTIDKGQTTRCLHNLLLKCAQLCEQHQLPTQCGQYARDRTRITAMAVWPKNQLHTIAAYSKQVEMQYTHHSACRC